MSHWVINMEITPLSLSLCLYVSVASQASLRDISDISQGYLYVRHISSISQGYIMDFSRKSQAYLRHVLGISQGYLRDNQAYLRHI